MEKSFWQSDEGARVLIDNLQDGIYVIEDSKVSYANQRIAEILGYPVDELIGRPFVELVAAGDRALILERYRARLSGEIVPEQYDIHLITAQGTVICCALNICLLKDRNGKTVSIGSARDVSRQKEEMAELETSKTELKAIFDQLPDVFYRTDMQGIITMISPSCYELLGYLQEAILGSNMADYYETPAERMKVVQAITDGGGKATRVEAGLRHKNGSIIWVSTSAVVRFGHDGKPSCIEGLARDISERKRMEEQLTALTRTDGLTSVYSRSYFLEKSEEVINMMRRYQRPASMMMMDLDHFKKINDNYGHHIGDLALIAFTGVCKNEIRESDVLGRLGGEEFALMLPETSIQNAQILAERIRKSTAEIEIPLAGDNIKFTVSIGLVELNVAEPSLDNVLHCADLAMYQAKESGRNQVVTFSVVSGTCK